MDGQTVVSKHHFTFTWKQKENDLKLIHAMACHLRDFPAPENPESFPPKPVQAKIFETQPELPIRPAEQEKISIRDVSGKIRYLYPDEIIYIQASDKICNIYTKTETFSSRMTLNTLEIPSLLNVHKSYRVNKRYIREIHRYQATLSNGVQIPVGKSRYMDAKKALQSQ